MGLVLDMAKDYYCFWQPYDLLISFFQKEQKYFINVNLSCFMYKTQHKECFTTVQLSGKLK